jgi:hypothetical protein
MGNKQNKTIKLKDIHKAQDFECYDMGGPFESDYGLSYVLSLRTKKGEYNLWLGEKTAAYKCLKTAEAAGQLDAVLEGGTVMIRLIPRAIEGTDHVKVLLRVGQATKATDDNDSSDAQTAIPF